MGYGKMFGLGDDETLKLVFALEKVCAGHGLARTQLALANALWRTTSRHPSYAGQADFIMDSMTIRDGGRRIAVEVLVFPPRDEPDPAPPAAVGDDSPGGRAGEKKE